MTAAKIGKVGFPAMAAISVRGYRFSTIRQRVRNFPCLGPWPEFREARLLSVLAERQRLGSLLVPRGLSNPVSYVTVFYAPNS